MARLLSTFVTLSFLSILRSKGSPEIGFSARLKSNFKVKSSLWTPVGGWEVGGSQLLFEYGIKLDKSTKQSAKIPLNGIFLISANLNITSKNETKLKACITQKFCHASDQNENTVIIATLIHLLKGEKIMVKLYGSESFTVQKDSSFAVQYLGSASRPPGFMATLQRNQSMESGASSDHTVKNWIKQGTHYTQNNLERDWPANFEKLSVSCNGVYLISATLSFEAADSKYEIAIKSNSTKVLTKDIKIFRHKGIATVTLFNQFQLRRSEELSIHIRGPSTGSIKILKGSRFNAVYIGPVKSKLAEFSEELPNDKTFNAGQTSEHILKVPSYLPQNIIEQKGIKVTKNSKQISMPKHGVYVISLHLNVKMSPKDKLTTRVFVFKEGLKTTTSVNGRLYSQSSGQYQEISLLLTGVLTLQSLNFITISFKLSSQKSFQILKNSRISFTAVRSHDLAASFTIERDRIVERAMASRPGLALNATQPFAFPLNEFVSNDKREFRCPLRGVYQISLNVVISGHKGTPKDVNLQIVRRTPRLDSEATVKRDSSSSRFTSIFNASVTVHEGLATITPSFLYNLKDSDLLSFHVYSSSNIEVLEKSSLFMSLVDFIEAGGTFIASLPKKPNVMPLNVYGEYQFNSWVAKTAGSVEFSHRGDHIAPKTGYYTVSTYLQIKSTFKIDISNLELTLFVYFDDKNRNFGLLDKVKVIAKVNDTMNFFFTVNGIVEARKDARLRTVLKSSERGVNLTAITGQLSITLHDQREYTPETFRNLQSSTKLLNLANGGWENIGKPIDDEANGEFKSANVEILGLRFHAYKSLVAFASATTIVYGIDGTVEYGIVVHGSDVIKRKGLTIEAEVNSKSLTTLKWSGLVYMEPWQQLALAIRRKDGGVVSRGRTRARTSWSSFSFVAISFPESAEDVNSKDNAVRPTNLPVPSDAWYLINKHYQPVNKSGSKSNEFSLQLFKKGDKFGVTPDNWDFQAISLPRFKLTRSENRMLNATIKVKANNPYALDKLFSEIKTLRNYLSKRKEKGNGRCIVGLLSVKLALHSEVKMALSLAFRSAFVTSVLSQTGVLRNETKTLQHANETMDNDTNTIAYVETILEYNGVVCSDSFQTIAVSSKSDINATITKDSKFSFALIDSLNNVEGFSAAQRANQVLALDSDLLTRIDGWYVNHSFGFDSSTGFGEPYGSYVVPTSGNYFVTANLILLTKNISGITLALYLGDGPIPQAVIHRVIVKDTISTINLASLIKVDKWRLLQLKVKANISVSMTILSGSTISAVLLDQDVALDRCESNLLHSQTTSYNNKAYRIGADVIIPCGTKDSRIVDFYWLQDNRVVKFIPSSKDGTLVINSATSKHSGIYMCRIQTGDYAVVSHKIKIFVYDPRPTIIVGNLTLFVPENSPPDQNLMDIKVQAKTSRETDDALVELSVLPAGLSNTFYISPKQTNFSAMLKSSVTFDYESRDEYKITLKAVNKDFPVPELAESEVNLTVKVIDRNDNPPKFEKKSVVVSILENATVGEFVHEVKASDKDTGVNAEVRYSIHFNRDSKYFEINEKTGKIKITRPLAKDGRKYYTLFVIANNKPYSAFIEVLVKVVDVNNHRPYFKPVLYTANVTEATEIGSIVSRVFAHDSDTEAINKQLIYKLDDSATGKLPDDSATGKLPISIDNDGNIHVVQKLRKYAGKILKYKVLAFDGIGLRSTNEATIVLRVLKTSIMPSFSSGLRFSKDSYRVSVREDANIGTIVTTVRAYNPDNSHYQLRYVLMKSTKNNSFTISETSGEIFTSTKLDYETTKEYTLTVFACDVEGKSDCTATKVAINVENVNDNPPKFSRLLYERSVDEDVEFGFSLLTVTATDADLGDHGNVKYALASQGTDLPFMIGVETGIVKVMGNLRALKANKCMFAVAARNGKEMKNAEEALIIIKIIRKKEKLDLVQLPTFAKDVYEVSISEDEKLGTKLLKIKVSSLNSAAIRYSLVANNNMTFETDKEKGGLILKKKLDYETTKKYDLILIAQLNDEITLRSSTRIVARVTDVNDNPPMFIQPNFETYLRGGITTGRLVTKIHAYDIDSGINRQLVYKFDSNSKISEFSLNPTNGDLRVNKLSSSRVFYLPIIACDKGIPSHCARSKVTVHIAKDSYRGSLASNMLESNFTFMALEFNVDQYIPDPREEVKVRFLAQEIHENDPNHKIFSQLPPTTWYDVNYKRKEGNNYLRRYVASEKITVLENDSRIRRGLSNQKMKKIIKFKYGDEDGCAEVWKANTVCNGPLRPGTKYRFQLEFGYKGSKGFLKTGFTKEYTTGPGPPAALEVKMVPKQHFPYWIALIATSSSLLLVLIIIFICCCYHRIKTRRLRKNRFEVATQKDNASGDYFMPWKTETESQELTVWFSEDKLTDGESQSKHSQNNIANL